jgi:hypothetical protein
MTWYPGQLGDGGLQGVVAKGRVVTGLVTGVCIAQHPGSWLPVAVDRHYFRASFQRVTGISPRLHHESPLG